MMRLTEARKHSAKRVCSICRKPIFSLEMYYKLSHGKKVHVSCARQRLAEWKGGTK